MYVKIILFFLLLALLVSIVVCAVIYTVMVLRGDNCRLMLSSSSRTLCDGPGRVCISALCVDIGSADRIGDLLAVEYEYYEVIVAVDSLRTPALLRDIVERYSLVAVDYTSPDMGALPGVTTLYRSRCRRFKRLTVADITSVSPEIDMDAVMDIAVYDYVMPLTRDMELLHGAVERLAAEICLSPQRPHEVHTESGAELAVYLRDDVAAAGGFASCRRYFCRPKQRVSLYETLAVDRTCHRAGAFFGWMVGVVVIAFAALVSFIVSSVWPVVAAVAAFLSVAASVLPVAGIVSPHLKGYAAYRCTLRCFCEKILLKISQ